MELLACIAFNAILVITSAAGREDTVEDDELGMPPLMSGQLDAGANLIAVGEGW